MEPAEIGLIEVPLPSAIGVGSAPKTTSGLLIPFRMLPGVIAQAGKKPKDGTVGIAFRDQPEHLGETLGRPHLFTFLVAGSDHATSLPTAVNGLSSVRQKVLRRKAERSRYGTECHSYSSGT